jgi:predicted dehydrogenase
VVHFRTASGTNGVLVQSARDWGTPIELTRVTGSTGTVWLDRSAAWIADGTGRRRLEPPPWAAPPPAEPSRDVRHRFTHLELGPWTRLAAWVADALAGRWPWPPTRGPEVAPATFIQGVSTMEVLDAVRSSAAERGAVIPVELIRTGG